MTKTVIKLGYAHGESKPANLLQDHLWFREHEAELLQQYGQCVLLIYQQQVIGVGQSVHEARMDAEKRLTDNLGIITPMNEWLAPRHPFLRAYPHASGETAE